MLHNEDGTEGRVADKYTLTPGLWEYLQNYARSTVPLGNGFGFGLVPRTSRPHPVSAVLQGRLGDPCRPGSEAPPVA